VHHIQNGLTTHKNEGLIYVTRSQDVELGRSFAWVKNCPYFNLNQELSVLFVIHQHPCHVCEGKVTYDVSSNLQVGVVSEVSGSGARIAAAS
jgi:hypothetical protein